MTVARFKKLRRLDCHLCSGGEQLLNLSIASSHSNACEVELVEVSVKGLGFDVPTARSNIYARALEKFGLHLCPLDIGIWVLVGHSDQSVDEWLNIGMEPVKLNDLQQIYRIGRNSMGQWLSVTDGSAQKVWDLNERWVFVAGT